MDNTIKDTISEALLRKAVIDDHMNELNAIPSNDELAAIYTFSDRHEVRMRALFQREKRWTRRNGFFTAMKRVAVFIAIAGTVLFGLLLTNPDVRAAVKETIVEWFETFTRYSYNRDAPEDMNVDWSFGYIPDGYNMSDRYELGMSIYIVYTDESSNEITLYYATAKDTSMGVDNEHSSLQIVFEQGIEYHVYESTSDEYPSSIVWTQQGYALDMHGFCSAEELLRMAKSAKK